MYDPVSGTGSERLNAMHFGLETVPAGAQHGHGGMVYVADAPEVGKLKHITVEVSFRFSEGLPAGWNSAPLVMMTGSSYSAEGFMLGMGWTGQMAVRYCSSAARISSPTIRASRRTRRFTRCPCGRLERRSKRQRVKLTEW